MPTVYGSRCRSGAGEAAAGRAGAEWLSVLGRDEAYDMLRDFFEDAAFVRRNLRLAMEESC